jgi:hypothetical protein
MLKTRLAKSMFAFCFMVWADIVMHFLQAFRTRVFAE